MTYIPELPNDWLNRQTKEIESKINSGVEYIGVEVQQEYNPKLGIPITYGLRRINGPIIYLTTKPTDTTTLYMAILLGEGQMGPIYRVFVDDLQVRFEAGLTAGQTPLPHNTVIKPNVFDRLRPSASTNDELATFEYIDGRFGNVRSTLLGEVYGSLGPIYSETAYLVCKFKFREGKFSGLPKVTVDMFGRLYTNLDGTWGTNPYNPVDHLYDYMTNARYGAGIPTSQIDVAGWTTLANTINTTGVLIQKGSVDTTPFIQNSITLDPNDRISDNIKKIIDDHGLVLSYSGGKYRLTLESKTSTVTDLAESKILNSITINKSNSANRFTEYIVDYENSRSEYYSRSEREPKLDPYPKTNVYQIRDGGKKKVGRRSAPGITLQWLAQQTARKNLLKSRSQETYTFTALREAFQFTVGDVISVTATVPSLTAQKMRIIRMRVNENFEIEVTCVTHDDAFYPPFDDIFASQGAAINFPPNKEIPSDPGSTPPIPNDPPPNPGDPGGAPVIPPAIPKPVDIFTLDQIKTPAGELTKVAANTAWPTVTGNSDFYLGEIFIQRRSLTTNWSAPLARDTNTSFGPPNQGASGSLTFNAITYSSTGYYSFGVTSILDQLSGATYGQAANTIYVFKQAPMITYRRQDASSATLFNNLSGKYNNNEYLLFTYSLKVNASTQATTQWGWQRRGDDGVMETFVADLTSSSIVTFYRAGVAKPQYIDYTELLNLMPKLRYKRNPYNLGGGSYGFIDPKDPTTHTQYPLNILPSATPAISAYMPDDVNWSHFGTLDRSNLFRRFRFRIFAIKTQGLPEFIGEVASHNDVRMTNAKGLNQGEFALTSKNIWRLAKLPGTLGQIS